MSPLQKRTQRTKMDAWWKSYSYASAQRGGVASLPSLSLASAVFWRCSRPPDGILRPGHEQRVLVLKFWGKFIKINNATVRGLVRERNALFWLEINKADANNVQDSRVGNLAGILININNIYTHHCQKCRKGEDLLLNRIKAKCTSYWLGIHATALNSLSFPIWTIKTA